MDDKVKDSFDFKPMLSDDELEIKARSDGQSLGDYLDSVNSYIERVGNTYGYGEKKEEVVFSARNQTAESEPAAAETGFEADFFGVNEAFPEMADNTANTKPDAVFDNGGASADEEVYFTEKPVYYPAASGSAAAEKEPVKKQGKLGQLLGNYRFASVTTAVNFVYCIFWLISYIISVFSRESFFAQYEARMAADGIFAYHVELASPFFVFLKVLLYLLAVVIILWTVAVVLGDKNKKDLPGKKLLLAVFGVDVIVGITAVIDAASVGLLFT